MNNKICVLVFSILFIGCDSTYFLKVDDCYVHKNNYEYSTIYTSLQHIVLNPELHIIIDDIRGSLKFDMNNIHFFMNEEQQMLNWHKEENRNSTFEEPFLKVNTEQGENRDKHIFSAEFIIMKFYLDYSLPIRGDEIQQDSFNVKVKITDIEHCLTESDCEPQNYQYSFTYFIEDDKFKARRTDDGTAGWWREPGVEVCTGESGI